MKLTEKQVDNVLKTRDAWKKSNEVKDLITPTPPQEGLIPLPGTPFLVTPDVIDPTDCEHWSGSPYCGSDFYDGKVGIGIDVVADECNIGVQFSPSLYFKLPERQIVYRNPNCRPEPPPKGVDNEFVEPFDFPPIDDDAMVNIAFDEFQEFKYSSITDSSNQTYETTTHLELLELRCQPTMLHIADFRDTTSFNGSYSSEDEFNIPDYRYNNGGVSTWWIFNQNGDYLGDIAYTSEVEGSPDAHQILIGKMGLIKGMCNGVYKRKIRSSNLALRNAENSSHYPIWKSDYQLITEVNEVAFFRQSSKWTRKYIINTLEDCISYTPPEPNRNPPPPKECPPCMTCCNKSEDDSNALLNLILQRIGTPTVVTIYDSDESKPDAQPQVRKLDTLFNSARINVERTEKTSKMIGIDAFPIELPESVIKPETSGIFAEIAKFFKWNSNKKLNSIAELMVWLIQQDSATMGQWHQVIEIEDADLTKEGNQNKKVVLPNVAETLKEIIILLIELTKTSELALDVNLKNLTETSATHLDAAKAKFIIEDIQQYLDYQTRQLTKDVPIQVTIPDKNLANEDKEDVYKYLVPSMHKIVYDDWNGNQSLADNLLDILQVLATVRVNNQSNI